MRPGDHDTACFGLQGGSVIFMTQQPVHAEQRLITYWVLFGSAPDSYHLERAVALLGAGLSRNGNYGVYFD